MRAKLLGSLHHNSPSSISCCQYEEHVMTHPSTPAKGVSPVTLIPLVTGNILDPVELIMHRYLRRNGRPINFRSNGNPTTPSQGLSL